MYIDHIHLDGYRNYQNADISFAEGINIITGGNAQGKTNLLEAISYLSSARSFRIRGDKSIINLNSDNFRIKAHIVAQGRESNIEIISKRTGRKQIYVNGIWQKTSAGLSGRFNTVLFCPEDLQLIKGSAGERRRFMDAAICQLRPKYAAALSEFTRLYEHKTRILKDHREKNSLLSVLDDFNIRIAKVSSEIIIHRALWCKRLNEIAPAIHGDITNGSEKLTLQYKTIKTMEDPSALNRQQIFQALMEDQIAHKFIELDAGQCLSGAHKDNIMICIDGNEARIFASQGQARTAALSLKLAEREINYNDCGEYPVLLLDDVLSELDSVRQDFVLNRITDGQVFITCCEGSELTEKTNGNIITVKQGAII